MEDPGDFVSPEEEIPCIAACGIQKNAAWDSVISRSDGFAPRSTQNNAIGHPEPNDLDARMPNDIDLTDHVDEEEETNGVLVTGDDSPRRPPTLLRELNLAIIDDEPGRRLTTSRENGTPTLNKSKDQLCFGRDGAMIIRLEIDEHLIQ
jgi:hypothetical protein